MPVLVNSQSGLAENLPQEHADVALNSGTHEIPLNDPQGNPVTAPVSQAQSLIQQGYSQPSPGQLKSLLSYSKYSSTPEQIKTALEGAGEAATFGGSTALERAAGVNPEAIQGRREVNPGLHMAGEAAGLAASSLIPGAGEANVLRGAGEVAAGAAARLGIGAGEGVLAKVGSGAIKAATENAILGSADEASKMFSQDPNQSAETAMTNIGLNAVLGGVTGGALGTVPAAWQAAQGTSLGKFLSAITNKANGLERSTLPEATIGEAATKAGIDLAPEVKSSLSENPEARGMFQALQESTTRAGKEAQASMNQFKIQSGNAILSSLGKTGEDVANAKDISPFDLGNELKESLKKEIETKIDPLTEQFQKIKEQYSDTPIEAQAMNNLSDSISKFSQEQGYHLLEGSPQGAIVDKVLSSLPNVKTLEDLRKITSNIGELTQNPEMWNLGKGLKGILRNGEEDILGAKLGAEAPDLLATHQQARGAYQQAMQTIDDLNDRLHVGKYAGPGTFVKALDDMKPEDVLRRLTPRNDASLLQSLDQNFGGTSNLVKNAYMSQALQAGSKGVQEGHVINPNNLFKAIGSWSPELRQYALPQGAESQLGAIQDLLGKIPKSMNPSGTAKTIDALWSKVPGGATSMVSLLTGHNPIAGYVLGSLGRMVGREVPDAIKLATLKFLGSDAPISSPAFKALAELAVHSIKGQNMTKNAIGSIFKSGMQVAPQAFSVKSKEIEKLKEKVDQASQDPTSLLQVAGHVNHYAPGHAQAFGATSARAVQYLNTLKPNESQMGAFGAKRVPSAIEKAKYNNALEIAQQPLTVIGKLKKGNLTPDDVNTVRTIYPNLYKNMVAQLTTAAIDHVGKGNSIPYKTKLQMALFTGSPMDASMGAQALQRAQSSFMVAQAPAQQQARPSKKGMESFQKGNAMAMTPNQSRETTRQASA